jgi:hypothetical protein
MERYHESLLRTHRKEEARQVQDQLEAIAHQPQPDCINCTVSAFSMRSPAAVPALSACNAASSANASAALSTPPAEAAPQP